MSTCTLADVQSALFSETCHRESDYIAQPFDIPDSSEPADEPDDPSDVDDFDVDQDDDDARWEVFIPDDDEYDPAPDPSDFWNDEFPNDE
jgi:hypothetical protein